MFIPQKIFGILGYPLGHSLSPLLHNFGFQTLNYPGAYFRFEKQKAELNAFMQSLRQLPISGLSVTIPHKEAVIPFLDKITPEAKQAGAVNTIYWEDTQLCGDNTDIIGFSLPLEKMIIKHTDKSESYDSKLLLKDYSSLILGAGGAARAAIIGLKKMGCNDIQITARRKEQAEELATEFNIKTIAWEKRAELPTNILVNSTPLGLKGERESLSPLPDFTINPIKENKLNNLFIAYDLIYSPAETVFLKTAKAQNRLTLNGLPMFIEQGLAQFKRWTGHDLDYNQVLNIIKKAL
ncbi:shikimate dehydrogenase [Desulfovibrio litoralis]|uniref:Shikimate dehydrogenase (NADP(+)) n=1 Tax=Desulfovibrio litoralis DSM 11393 TaxID=1121455 RepID=A0A1M7T427_9BACT|nr:shikimate dehydrogenase [Desulfovibrio litoralis]SHN65422.1 shikimate dehydrogenase [Desulfovibrio litoralis DSM 11393]